MTDIRPSPAHVAAKVATRLRARGPREVLGLGLARVGEAISSADSLIMFGRTTAPGTPEREDLSFREAATEDASIYARDIGTDSAATFGARLSDATHCFVVESEGRFVHASWLTTAAAWTREIRRYLRPPDGDGYIYESYTRPEVRGRGVYPFALEAIVGWAHRAGIARLWVAIEAHNRASHRAVSKAGFEETFTIAYSRRLGRLVLEEPRGAGAETGRAFIARSPRS